MSDRGKMCGVHRRGADVTLLPESVWDYPRPPRLEPVRNEIRILFANRTVALTGDAWRVLETSHPPTYYLPREAFRCEIVAAGGGSFCEWKGRAAYWTLRADGQEAARAAWSYPAPTAPFAAIADHLAVYCAAMESCFVGAERATPQPGGFYGGWVTANLAGPFKGGPGSAGW